MAGVLALTRCLAADYMDSGVLINSMVFGPLVEAELGACLDSYKKRVPLGRVMTVADLKNALDIFLDPDSSYITGQNLIADGGVSIW
jgi:3-oxoacyl-[acyl-carrier protein] reductase